MTNKIPKRKDRPGIDRYGRSELHNAVSDNDMQSIQVLLKDGSDINQSDDNGWTPLHFAAQNYSANIIEYLITAGADVNKVDLNGNTPLFRAIFNSIGKDLSVLNLFINAGADLNKKIMQVSLQKIS